jgi:pimeloyl-ACP methyl ester carboxylesterase
VVKIPGKFDDSTFERTASSFDNPDFVDVVIHCYRFCFGIAAGDPALASLEARLAAKPKIGIPTITFDGTQDPLKPGRTANHAPMFINRHEHRVVDCGDNLPWEAPHDFADAILTVRG